MELLTKMTLNVPEWPSKNVDLNWIENLINTERTPISVQMIFFHHTCLELKAYF